MSQVLKQAWWAPLACLACVGAVARVHDRFLERRRRRDRGRGGRSHPFLGWCVPPRGRTVEATARSRAWERGDHSRAVLAALGSGLSCFRLWPSLWQSASSPASCTRARRELSRAQVEPHVAVAAPDLPLGARIARLPSVQSVRVHASVAKRREPHPDAAPMRSTDVSITPGAMELSG